MRHHLPLPTWLAEFEEYLDGKRPYHLLRRYEDEHVWRCQICDQWYLAKPATFDPNPNGWPVLCPECIEIHRSGKRQSLPVARVIRRRRWNSWIRPRGSVLDNQPTPTGKEQP